MENFEQNLDIRFQNCFDYSKRVVGENFKLFYLIRISDREFVSDKIVRPMIERYQTTNDPEKLVNCRDIKKISTIEDAIFGMLRGGVVVEDKRKKEYYLCFADIPSGRTISEPDTDVTVHGSHAGFVESMDANLTELRKYLRTEHLKFELLVLGEETKTNAALVYLDNVIKEEVLDDIKNKISKLKLRSGIDSDSIKLSLSGRNVLFPIIGSYEKPDIVSSKLLGGRAALVVDGSPFVLTFPYLFVESIQSPEDYTKSYVFSSFLRILRILGLSIAVLLPSIIIASIYHNQQLLPFEMLIAITSSRKGIALGIFGEMLVSLFIFEIIREVGQRMPKAVGDAVGIVASIILGDAAVKAGISSMVVIMVVALCAVSNFVVPTYKDTTVLLRFVYMFFSYGMGFFGIMLLNSIILIILIEKKSFGIYYLTPLAPLNSGIKDFIISFPTRVTKRGDKGIAKDK